MALMWPRKLPSWVVHDPRRAAEREVFNKLDLALDEKWSVYYSRPWWGLSKTGGEIDGEADFIVAHPNFGVLFLEVKGGQISYDPSTSKWTSTDRLGVKHTIKDPVQQAVKSKHELFKKFRKLSNWPIQRVRLRHGVILTDCQPKDNNLICGYEQQIFCFANELRDRLRSWIMQRLSSHGKNGFDQEVGPGLEGIDAIDSTIASPARLSVPLYKQLECDVGQQDALMTGAQLQAISFIDGFPRVVVEGGAGTGKTIIACELAKRYSSKGLSVALCCLSEPLANSLKQRIGVHDNLDVVTVQELRSRVSAHTSRCYEALIVDEGQDVDWSDWDLLERLMSQGCILRVLYDSNQAVYRARDDLEVRLQAKGLSLHLNLRNTQRIALILPPTTGHLAKQFF